MTQDSSAGEYLPDEFETISFLTAGMFGVVVPKGADGNMIQDLRLRMIESRILRIEEFIKRTGFDLNTIDLNTIQSS